MNATGNLFDQRTLGEKAAIAIKRIRAHAPRDGSPVYVAFSGGKDSLALKLLVQMAGVPADYHYNVTTVDPPELVAYIRAEHPEVQFEWPRLSMYQACIERKMLPTRLIRFCCEILKERGGYGRPLVLTGVRWAESQARAKRAVMVRPCIKRETVVVNPMIDWLDDDVWALIRGTGSKYCSLYDEGFTRLGCIGCPMAGPAGMAREFVRWPGFLKVYYRAVEKMLPAKIASRLKRGKLIGNFGTPRDFILWWLRDLTKDQRHAKIVSALIDAHCERVRAE